MWAGSLKSELYRNRLGALRASLRGLMPSFAQLVRRVERRVGTTGPVRAQCARRTLCRPSSRNGHGADPRKARLAGLLHDLARLYSPERLVARMRSPWSSDRNRRAPASNALGTRSSVPRLRATDLGFAIRHVLSAIEKHTTAAREMSPLYCIVYLADSLEPNRSFPERADLWRLALDRSRRSRCGQCSF